MKILTLFGSKSDEKVYNQILKKTETELKICSAHKTPNLLDELLKKDYDLIIAGAGLAAHLPGVIASKTVKPVVGIPCTGNLDGLDALLSIMQMPGGIAVASTGIENTDEAVNFAKLLKKKYFGERTMEDKNYHKGFETGRSDEKRGRNRFLCCLY